MFLDRNIHSSSDARRLARRRLPWMVFDYIDGAAGDETGENLNRQKLAALRMQPRILNNVEHRSLAVPVFDHDAQLPFGVSPMGMCNLACPQADLKLAAAAAHHQFPLGVSTAASTSLEEQIKAADGHAWFQLYFGGDETVSNGLLDRASAAGYRTVVLTVDVPEVGRRPRELRRGFKMPFKLGPSQLFDLAFHPMWSLPTLIHGRPQLANFGGDFGAFDRTSSRAGADWDFLDRVRDKWKGNLVVKGVLDPRDALELKKRGVDAVQVSSHGGRQLDSAPSPIDVLPAIRRVVGPEFAVFYDSGIRNGEDIVKAYALGADFVFIGRPFQFALAANGSKGLAQMIDVFEQEVSLTLAQLGLTKMAAVDDAALYSPQAQ